MDAIVCPACDTPNGAERHYCRSCATPLDCPHCHFRNGEEDRFCGGCGQPLEPVRRIAEAHKDMQALQEQLGHPDAHEPQILGYHLGEVLVDAEILGRALVIAEQVPVHLDQSDMDALFDD